MIYYNSISCVDPGRDVLRCLPPDDGTRAALLTYQGAFGIGAYDQGLFVGSLWFYRVEELATGNPYAPAWSGCGVEFQKRLPIDSLQDKLELPILALSCYHVGRTKALEALDRNDESYYRRGIGSGLLQAALAWAQERDYALVIATSGMDSFAEFNLWAGLLPLKSYLKAGFRPLKIYDDRESIPGHLAEKARALDPVSLAQSLVVKALR